MSKASELKNSLTREQLDFYEKKTLSSTMKIKDWIAFLTAIAQLDKLGDQKAKRLLTFGIISIVLGVISIFITIALESLPLTVLPITLICTGIVLLINRKKVLAKDISNYLREFFIPLLHMLKEKAGETTKLSAKVDFRNPRHALTPEKSVVRGRDQKLYTPIYIISRLTLQDQVMMEFVVQEDIKDLTWTSRSSSGKTKYKSKTKLVHLSTIKMTVPKSEYSLKSVVAPEVEVEENESHYMVKSKIKIKKIGNHVLHVKAFIDAIQTIYSQFNPLNQPQESESTNSVTSDADHNDIGYIAPYVWYGGYFDRYDYDSFDHTQYEDGTYEEIGATAFDS